MPRVRFEPTTPAFERWSDRFVIQQLKLFFQSHSLTHTLSLSLSLSHTHTHTHMYKEWDTRQCSRLRQYAKSRKVACSFQSHYVPGVEPASNRSIRNLPGSKGRAVRKADDRTAIF
jgi:hypothetical protein